MTLTVVRPVTGFPITQIWGQLENQPWGARNANGAGGHPGVDYGCPNGTPVLSVADGVCIYAGPASGFGDHLVSIWHPQFGVTSRYGHMQAHLAAGGEVVTAGQQIGVSNNEGASTGPHLHFEIGTTNAIDAGNPPNIDGEAWLVANLGNNAPDDSENIMDAQTAQAFADLNAKIDQAQRLAMFGANGQPNPYGLVGVSDVDKKVDKAIASLATIAGAVQIAITGNSTHPGLAQLAGTLKTLQHQLETLAAAPAGSPDQEAIQSAVSAAFKGLTLELTAKA